MCSVTISENIV